MTVDCDPADHDRVKADAAAFAALEQRGTQSYDFGDPEGVEHYIVANCTRCRSTLYRRCTAAEVVAAVKP